MDSGVRDMREELEELASAGRAIVTKTELRTRRPGQQGEQEQQAASSGVEVDAQAGNSSQLAFRPPAFHPPPPFPHSVNHGSQSLNISSCWAPMVAVVLMDLILVLTNSLDSATTEVAPGVSPSGRVSCL